MFRSLVNRIKKSSHFTRTCLIARRVAAKSTLTTRIYYLFDDSFSREQYCVINGANEHCKNFGYHNNSSPVLRRNIHRIEKGLLMRPRRKSFARDFIVETVTAYKFVSESCGENGYNCSEILWARDVLSQYFEVVETDELIEQARLAYESSICDPAQTSQGQIPYLRDLESPLSVSYESFVELSKRRRSVRWFEQRPVPRNLLDMALLVAAQSPSACNRQPYTFHIIDDPVLCHKAAKIPGGTGGYADNIPTFLVLTGKLGNYATEADRHLIYIDAALAAMGFVYAAETLGLGTCMINWQDDSAKEQQMTELLKLEVDERPVVCIAVGFPDPEGYVACSTKKDLLAFRKYHGN